MRISIKVPEKFKSTKFLVFAVFLLALILRLWGVWHGLPYIYSVDEPALVHSVLGLRFDLNPHHFDWPHFHFYLSYLVFGIFYKVRVAWQVWGWKGPMEAIAPILWNDGAIFYLLLRLLSVFMGALTVIPVYLSAKNILGTTKRALLTATFLAIAPFHVENSKYALIDVPATLWVAISFYFSVKIFKKPTILNYILAGVFGGLAASTKYNAVLILLMLILVHLARQKYGNIFDGRFSITKIIDLIKGLFGEWWKLVLAGLASVVAFFAGTPYALLDFKTFTRSDSSLGALWQLGRSGTRVELAVFGRLLDSLVTKIGAGFGYFALALAIIGVVTVFRSKNILLKAVAWFTVIFYLYVGSSQFAPIQIFQPIFIPLAILSVVGGIALINFIRAEFFETPIATRIGVMLLTISLLVPSLASTLKVDYLYTGVDTRNIAKQIIDKAIPEGKVIGMEGEYQPYYEGTHPIIGVPAWRYDPLSEAKIDYVVVTGYNHVRDIEQDAKFGGILDNITPIYEILNGNDREGPNIFIYKINYPLANQWWLNAANIPSLSTTSIIADKHAWRDTVLPVSHTSTLISTGTWDVGSNIKATMKVKNDYGFPTDFIGGHLNKFDLTLVPLFTPLKDGCKPTEDCVSDNAKKMFIDSGVDVVNTSELLDPTETEQILTKSKIASSNLDKISYLQAKNIKYGFVSVDLKNLTNPEETISKLVKKARSEAAVVVVSITWLNNRPNQSLAHVAVDAGATAVLGVSSDVQGIEFYKNSFISYGSGRLVSDTTFSPYGDWTRNYGVAWKLYFFDSHLVDVDMDLNETTQYDKDTGFSYRPKEVGDYTDRASMLEKIRDLSVAYGS